MSQPNFQDIIDFHQKFGIEMPNKPQLLDPVTMDYRLKFLVEEHSEIIKGYFERDIHQVADGLIDLVYVAMGTAYMMGLPWQALWDEVQRTNMSKQRAPSAEHSKRKNSLDIIKPEGWKQPDFTQWLGEQIQDKGSL